MVDFTAFYPFLFQGLHPPELAERVLVYAQLFVVAEPDHVRRHDLLADLVAPALAEAAVELVAAASLRSSRPRCSIARELRLAYCCCGLHILVTTLFHHVAAAVVRFGWLMYG